MFDSNKMEKMENCKHPKERKVLFEGGRTWPGNWKAAHSRVVSGISYSHLDNYPYTSQTEFHGWLDRRSVDSSGFAVIHTMNRDKTWDLSGYDGLEVTMGRSDGKAYSIALEDAGPFTWEGSFRAAGAKATRRVVQFSRFKPVCREGAYVAPLDLRDIGGFGIWIRNTDAAQEGGFSLTLHAISAVKLSCSCAMVVDVVSEERLRRRGTASVLARLDRALQGLPNHPSWSLRAEMVESMRMLALRVRDTVTQHPLGEKLRISIGRRKDG